VGRYDLTGHVVALDDARREVTIAHDAVPGYMDAMTMPFRVRESSALRTLARGDLIRGRLTVVREGGLLEAIEKVGYRELPVRVPAPAPASGEDVLLEGDPMPDVELTDENGRPLRLADGSPRAVVLTFVYTRCPFPTFCPLMDRRFMALQETIRADPRLTGRVRLLSITLDPSHDTPAVLKRHARRLGADPEVWSFLTADGSRIRALASRSAVSMSRDGGDVEAIVHNLATVVIDSRGVVRQIHRGNEWRPGDIIAGLAAAIYGVATQSPR
jgi:protein SCO1/2